jgi:hypothetical protein
LIDQILLICSTVLIYEFIQFVKLKDIIYLNLLIYKKIIKLFNFKKVSDFRKEKLIFNYSKSLFIISIKIFIILTCILIFMLFLNYLSNSFLNLIISVFGIGEITLIFIMYHQLRKKINERL